MQQAKVELWSDLPGNLLTLAKEPSPPFSKDNKCNCALSRTNSSKMLNERDCVTFSKSVGNLKLILEQLSENSLANVSSATRFLNKIATKRCI